MNRDEVLTLVREHLAEELEVDAAKIGEGTRFKEDLDADSLDLYELVMELEDRYGVAVSEEQAARIETVGDAVGFVARARPGLSRGGGPGAAVAALAALIDELPDDLRRQALTHSSWTERRVDSFERLAFLGDSVLGLAVAAEPDRALPGRRRRRPDQDPQPGGQRRLLRRGRPRSSACRRCCARTSPRTSPAAIPAEVLLDGERPLPEATEALIGACYLAFGFERTAAAVAAAFEPRIEHASETRIDFKSALQELLARRGARVSYEVIAATGPAAPAHLRGGGDRRLRAGRRRARGGARRRPSRSPPSRRWSSLGG